MSNYCENNEFYCLTEIVYPDGKASDVKEKWFLGVKTNESKRCFIVRIKL